MPRPITTKTDNLKVARQARYRERLRTQREPEADRVDTAIASAVAALADALDNNNGNAEDLSIFRILMQSTLNILRADGFDKEMSVKVLRRRITRISRPEIQDFILNGKTIQLLKKRK